MEYNELSKRMVKHVKGVPLFIKLLGRHFRVKDKEISEENQLKIEVPIQKIHNIVKLCYNDLDRHEKSILLEIACFFDGLHLKHDNIKLLVKDHDYSLDDEVDGLKNKALIIVSSDNVVSMQGRIRHGMVWHLAHQIINPPP